MEKLYFSDEIARKLAGMHQSGLVMLEAPAGYCRRGGYQPPATVRPFDSFCQGALLTGGGFF